MTSADYEFLNFVATHNKKYDTVEEFNFRKSIFEITHSEIAALNHENSTSVHGHNKMSDWTREEYSQLLGLKDQPMPSAENAAYTRYSAPAGYTPITTGWNWVDNGNTTPVKNQEQCGSCYAFSATETLESAWNIAGGSLYVLSPEQIVECSSAYGNQGCNGGWYFYAWNYLQTTQQATNASIPYTSGAGTVGSCNLDNAVFEAGVVATDPFYRWANTELADIQALVQEQPSSIAINASTYAFQTYQSGVFNPSVCSSQVDHAVQAVGYGFSGETPYLIVRNSWGTSWGDKGYMKLQVVSGKGLCGIQMEPNYTVV